MGEQAPFTVDTAMQSTQQMGNVFAQQKLKEDALAQKEQRLAEAEQSLVTASQQMTYEKQGMDNVLAALAQGQGAGGLSGTPMMESQIGQGLGNAGGIETELINYINQGGDPRELPAEAQQYLAQIVNSMA